MAKKPVITIDVNDDQFKRFYEMFNKYQGQVDAMPESWKSANEILNAGIAAIAEQTHNISKHLNSAITAQKQFSKATGTSLTGLKGMAKYAKEVKDSFFSVEKFVLKVGALGLGVFGGSLFGMDKLAGAALSQTRGARGLGVNTGALRAFKLDYSQIAPDTLPNSAYAAQRDLSKIGLLGYAAGISPATAANMDPVALSQLLVRRAHDYYTQNKGNAVALSQNTAMMQGFSAAGLGLEDVTRAGQAPLSDILSAQKNMRADRGRLNYGNGAIEQLFDFQRQLKVAGNALETDLAKRLAKLGPGLGGLVTVVEKDAEKLLNGVLSKKNMDAISKELDKFTTYLASGKAQDDIKVFASSLGDLANVIHAIAHPYDTAVNKASDLIERGANRLHNGYKLSDLPDDVPGAAEAKAAARKALSAPVAGGIGANGRPLTKAQEAKLEAGLGFLPGTLAALRQTESSGRANAVSGKGAMGLFQLMPATAKGLGVTDPFDPIQNELGGAKYLAQMRAFARRLAPGASGRDNMEMALAAYNYGPDNFQKLFAAHHDDWKKYLPSETKREISSFMQNLPQASRDRLNTPLLQQIARNTAQPVKVQVTMSTPASARVAVQANAAR